MFSKSCKLGQKLLPECSLKCDSPQNWPSESSLQWSHTCHCSAFSLHRIPFFFFFLLPHNSLLEAVLIANSTLIQGTSSPWVLQKHFLNYFNYNTYYSLVYCIWGCTCLLNTPWLDQVCIFSILACALHVVYDQDMLYWTESIKIWPGPNPYKHSNLCCTLVLIHTSTHTQWLKYFFN